MAQEYPKTDLFRLTYVSRLTAKAAAEFQSTVENILVRSAANNRRDRLTGLLICDGAYFAQALEGPHDLVRACFRRIQQDDRNSHVEVRDLDAVRSRAFPRWSMCGLSLSRLDDALLCRPDIDCPLPRMSAGALWQHLTSLGLRYARLLDIEHAELIRKAGLDAIVD